ncbi:hypothetical protein TNCV_67581 [Trichonephila clavipes]|nr:hypothetical protein TNCV_67581 [Trichonephila clavipes]
MRHQVQRTRRSPPSGVPFSPCRCSLGTNSGVTNQEFITSPLSQQDSLLRDLHTSCPNLGQTCVIGGCMRCKNETISYLQIDL